MTDRTLCSRCEGTGKCSECNGTGRILTRGCLPCWGTGKCQQCDGTDRRSSHKLLHFLSRVLRLPAVMSHIKSGVIIGILVAVGMTVLQLSGPYSLARSVLIFPLFPGLIAGLHEYTPVAFIFCLIVDTGRYWGIWMISSWGIRKLFGWIARAR